MLALVLVLTGIVLLLTVLVAGLLRSHADILRALHDLGAGVGDPARAPRASGRGASGLEEPVPITMGPRLPSERSSTTAPPLSGVTPRGDALAIDVGRSGRLTLLAFLSSGCATCAAFWSDLATPDRRGLPDDVGLVVITKGPELEVRSEVSERAGPHVKVVMSSEAWTDYEVPGSPFFVLVDGQRGRRIGEGVANQLTQVTEMVRRARADAQPFVLRADGAVPAGGHVNGPDRRVVEGTREHDSLDGPGRERENDRILMAAGIPPGHASLYPKALSDIMDSRPQARDRHPAPKGTDPR